MNKTYKIISQYKSGKGHQYKILDENKESYLIKTRKSFIWLKKGTYPAESYLHNVEGVASTHDYGDKIEKRYYVEKVFLYGFDDNDLNLYVKDPKLVKFVVNNHNLITKIDDENDGSFCVKNFIGHSWYKNGTEFQDEIFHNENGPATVNTYGKKWYLNGILHREDGPAVENVRWYLKKHTDDSQSIENANESDKEWWLNGKRHREDGPAVDYSFNKEWWLNNRRHREDGPAIEFSEYDCKSKTTVLKTLYYYNGEFLELITNQNEFEIWKKENIK